MTVMRAKMEVASVMASGSVGGDSDYQSETIRFTGVSKPDGYDETGLDEDNTFSKFTPAADMTITITNPALLGQLKEGEAYYLDFTQAE